MKSEVTIALLSLGGTVLGALIGAVVSAASARQQAQLSLKQLRLETLKSQISELKNALSSISSATIDVSEPCLPIYQIYSRNIDRFLVRAMLFKNVSYLFPVDIGTRISTLCEEISKYIFFAKIGGTIDEQRAVDLVNQIRTAEEEIDEQILQRLRSLHSELSMATFSRRNNK
jgi:gas vesicle protein